MIDHYAAVGERCSSPGLALLQGANVPAWDLWLWYNLAASSCIHRSSREEAVMLSDIAISHYRTFDSITIPFSPGVNLIVGTNNSGKSSLLEAIYLLTSDDPSASLLHLLNERGEYVSRTSDLKYDRQVTDGYQVSSIFHGRNFKKSPSITIGANSKTSSILSITLQEARSRKDPAITQQRYISEELVDIDNRTQLLVFEKTQINGEVKVENLRVTEDGLIAVRPVQRRFVSPDQNSKFITTNFVGYDELAILWDNITLTPQEDKVVEALKILEPDIERISFTSRQTSNSGILLKMRGERNPVSLGSMGDGMRRALAIAAALVSVENGTLLIDEIDTGLYYSTLTDIWNLILETSARRRVQVFATTHSWDCVRAFQVALSKYKKKNAGQLVRVERSKGGSVRAVVYSPDELEIALQQGIEVR